MNQPSAKLCPEPRTASAYQPDPSPLAHSIVTYRFGACPEATRPDRVMRVPTAAVLLQTRGMLFSRNARHLDVPLPCVALMGPSHQGQVWSTAPDTEFTLVNLAPGACRSLFGLDPRDIEDQVEALHGHPLATGMAEHLAQDRASLHRYLCSVSGAIEVGGSHTSRHVRTVLAAMSERTCGDHVADYADRFGLTMRTLQRLVRAAIGLTPKQVLAVERLRRVVTLTAGGWTRTRAELAQAAGFFDQSHMRHDILRQNLGSLGELLDGDHLLAAN